MPAGTAPTRPRTIPKNKIGEMMTSSQLSPRDWPKKNQAMVGGGATPTRTPRPPPQRTPQPQELAKAESTITLVTTGGNMMAKLYRELHELESDWGSTLGKKQLQLMILAYHQTADNGVLVTLEQFIKIIRGALCIVEDEKHTTRLFKMRAPRETTMVDMSKMLLEFIGYTKCPLADKVELAFAALTSHRAADHAGDGLFESDIPVDRDTLIAGLGYMTKVVDYYLQWSDDVFQSIEGTRVPGQHARHVLIPIAQVEQCAKRQDLLNASLRKCLAFSPHVASLIGLVQDQTNTLHAVTAAPPRNTKHLNTK